MRKTKLLSLLLLTTLFFASCGGFEYSLDDDIKNIYDDETKTEKEILDEEVVDESDTQEETDKENDLAENIDDTKVEIIEEDEIFCMEVYDPVCGLVVKECDEITSECEYEEQTFSNICYAEKAKAIEIKEGPCNE